MQVISVILEPNNGEIHQNFVHRAITARQEHSYPQDAHLLYTMEALVLAMLHTVVPVLKDTTVFQMTQS